MYYMYILCHDTMPRDARLLLKNMQTRSIEPSSSRRFDLSLLKYCWSDLVPVMDLEIGHINFSVSSKSARPAVSRTKMKVLSWTGTLIVIPLFAWLCVRLYGHGWWDCSRKWKRRGGESSRAANGTHSNRHITSAPSIQRCKGFGQGRYIEHEALQALCMTERITMVTSFRPRSSSIKDDSVLTAVSILGDLYHQFGGVSLWDASGPIPWRQSVYAGLKRVRRRLDTASPKVFIFEQIGFLAYGQGGCWRWQGPEGHVRWQPWNSNGTRNSPMLLQSRP